jgi:hypothetical protein
MSKKQIAIAIAVLALFICAMEKGWFFILFYGAFLWLACPQYNFLSPSCGEFTAEFILTRIYQVVFIVAVIITIWRLLRKPKEPKE